MRENGQFHPAPPDSCQVAEEPKEPTCSPEVLVGALGRASKIQVFKAARECM